MIDIIETVYRGASKGRGLVVSPRGEPSRGRGSPPLRDCADVCCPELCRLLDSAQVLRKNRLLLLSSSHSLSVVVTLALGAIRPSFASESSEKPSTHVQETHKETVIYELELARRGGKDNGGPARRRRSPLRAADPGPPWPLDGNTPRLDRLAGVDIHEPLMPRGKGVRRRASRIEAKEALLNRVEP